MKPKTITIRVNTEAARIFETVPEEQRRKLEALLSLKLSEVTRECIKTHRVGDRALKVY